MAEHDQAGWLDRLADRWGAFRDTDAGRRSIRAARILFLPVILAILLWQLLDIGLKELWSNLPTQPLFYVLFLVLYFFHILAELLIYRLSWMYRLREALPAFIKKRVYNRDVLGYSGEVYIGVWAQQNLGLARRGAAETVRDNNILSSLASTLVAGVLLAVFLSLGRISIRSLVGDHLLLYAGLAVAVPVVVGLLWLRFRHLIFSMPRNKAVSVFFMQIAHFLVGRAIQILQWVVVLPAVPLGIWFTYAAASILLSRVPFLPNQNLVFAGVGIEMSGMMDVPVAPIAGMLLVNGVLEKLLNILLFTTVSVQDVQPKPAAT
jgi:hypothetical protein